jgi:perosamine synthetase
MSSSLSSHPEQPQSNDDVVTPTRDEIIAGFAQYPYPKVPLTPLLFGRGYTFKTANLKQEPSILQNAHLRWVTSGRAAIALALEQVGVQKGDEVLIPAYHCESMISPTLWRDATPVFFKITRDASVDFEDLVAKRSDNTKAVLITHYFGVMQNIKPIRDWCDQHNLILIEDCAHAFFGGNSDALVGTVGDYAIASSMKFFPNLDGGILASAQHDLSALSLEGVGRAFELKSAINLVEKAVHYRRLGLAGKGLKLAIQLKEALWKCAKRCMGAERQQSFKAPASSEGGFGLDSAWIHKSMSKASKWVISHAKQQQLCDARRQNYQILHDRLSQLPGARPLYQTLPEGAIPLVYPLYVESLQSVFHELKMAGVPIWRFGELLDLSINEDVCAHSVDLSAHLIQFPCHQALTLQEINWMLNEIEQAFHRQAQS